ncbi:uncharacterized protein EDB91DRAFT_1162171 [Suillus paluster]|uniref:uncharacterized protein n=1 Tax=Suillus paluster TaxID=48578 RepID=UPI001B87FD5B|nr:uncharacterized protein EDB91DRAFT_1162171 [Suillus paluster]KAG1728396.1 hypothetical protein EDB91DRAFT_1162171 [Suillus paluster]
MSSSPPHNEVQLSREFLLALLSELSVLVFQEFGCQIRLFIHGGAVMILHPHLSTSSSRRTTRDIDYIRRAFGHEWRKKGVFDAEERLQRCINAVAVKFRIGTDWMNADPDVALPFAHNYTTPFTTDSKQPNNIDMNTIYKSQGLSGHQCDYLVRYKKEDPTDIVAMLRHGTKLNGVQWTPSIMETWIKTLCWPMGYNSYRPQQAEELRNRIHDAVHHLQMLPENSPEEPSAMAFVPPPALSSLHTMSSSLAPHPFSQPPSASSLNSIYMFHSLSPPAPMGERTRRSSINSLRRQNFSPPMPLSFTSSQSPHTIPHSHSLSQNPFRMPEPWAAPPPPLFQPMPSNAF